MDVRWDIRGEGRSWTEQEFRSRVDLRPEKLEVWEGKLLFSDEERLALLGLLLENMGADAAVKLGSSGTWREAVLGRPQPFLADRDNRQMLGVVLLTLIVEFGLIWLARAGPLPPRAAATLFFSAAIGFSSAALASMLLRD
jgi:hypothetical protein